MDVKVYSVKIEDFNSGYGYRKEHLVKYNKAKLVVETLNLNVALIDPSSTSLKLNDKGEEVYASYSIVESGASDSFVITAKQLLWLATSNIPIKVINETTVEVDDIVKTFNLCADKGLNAGEVITNTYNNKCDVHMPGNMLASYNEVMLLEDSCSDVLQESLQAGWRMIAVCPQPDQRRPDYILGRWNPDKDIRTSAVRG
jgi:hypothetical protein